MAARAIALRAPFPWFGGKSRVASLVWEYFGDCHHYVEPFAGSLAVLLGRPETHYRKIETVNDVDCHICNLWRSVQADPMGVIRAADWPISETDLHARHAYLVRWMTLQRRERFTLDPLYCEPRLAGWWLWGISQWIGDGWCRDVFHCRPMLMNAHGIHAVTSRQPPVLGPSYNGVTKPWRKRPEIVSGRGRGTGKGVRAHSAGPTRKLPNITTWGGLVSRKRPMLGSAQHTSGNGVHTRVSDWRQLILDLQERLRFVKVIAGDWRRVVTPAAIGTFEQAVRVCGVFLDPPYSPETGRKADLYANDSATVADDVRAWCLEHGDDPQLRIALCGLRGEHDALEAHGWRPVGWSSAGGMQRGEAKARRHLETIWFSPTCEARQLSLAMEASR